MKPFVWPSWAHREELELPFTNVDENEEAYVLGAELPGFAPEEVKVTMEENVLTIEGKHEEKKEEEGKSFRRFSEFRRQFRLPKNVSAAAIEAKMENGLLTVMLPKTEVPKLEVKNIEVKTPPPAPVAEPVPEKGKAA
ncbi:MAG: Hsp20/alpha crystallin family protein [Polyangiaceae bacterium]